MVSPRQTGLFDGHQPKRANILIKDRRPDRINIFELIQMMGPEGKKKSRKELVPYDQGAAWHDQVGSRKDGR